MKNKLWYKHPNLHDIDQKIFLLDKSIIRRLTGTTIHNVWHHRRGHPGTFITDQVDKSVDGIPSLKHRHPQFHCESCSKGKMTKEPPRDEGPLDLLFCQRNEKRHLVIHLYLYLYILYISRVCVEVSFQATSPGRLSTPQS